LETIPGKNYPGDCYVDEYAGKYCRKHNPFISFTYINQNETLCAKIVDNGTLLEDINANNLPMYSYYTPNLDNDGHDTNISWSGDYLHNFLLNFIFPIVSSSNTLVVITFDEDNHDEDNHIFTLLLGSMIPKNSTDNTSYTHASLLRTVQDNWNLGQLGREDVSATPFFPLKYTLPPSTETPIDDSPSVMVWFGLGAIGTMFFVAFVYAIYQSITKKLDEMKKPSVEVTDDSNTVQETGNNKNVPLDTELTPKVDNEVKLDSDSEDITL